MRTAEPIQPTATPTDGAPWLSAVEVAARLGVSVRSVQRRCHNGKLRARLVPTASGQHWEISAASILTNDAPDTNDATPATQTTPDVARYVAQIERENAFLRAQVEEGNRNAAELRAALRKALEIAPRQLTAGATPSPETSTPEPVGEPVGDAMDGDELLALCRRISK